jgi:hypothetical protein
MNSAKPQTKSAKKKKKKKTFQKKPPKPVEHSLEHPNEGNNGRKRCVWVKRQQKKKNTP